MVDGKNDLGFPLIFETEYANMLDDSGNLIEFNSLYLLIDIGFSLIVGTIAWWFTNIFLKRLR